MASPYGGDRGGGKKPSRKRGGQPGNVNRRGADLLPPAKDTEERRAFLDALQNAETMTASEQARLVRNYGFAKVVSLIEKVGLQKMVRFLSVLDGHRITEAKLGKCRRCGQAGSGEGSGARRNLETVRPLRGVQ